MKPLTRMTAPTVDVLRALLDAGGPIWGLRIVKDTARPTGTVYPILARLEQLGWITGEWEADELRAGPRRRLYRFSDEGAVEARRLISARDARATIPEATLATFGATL